MKRDVIGSIKRVNQVLRKQQGLMSPDSNGRGHGRLLRLVADNEGLSAKELAKLLEVRPPTLTEKLQALESDGLIYREQDLEDRRKTHLFLTPDGRMALKRRMEGEHKFEDRFEDCLSKDEQALFCEMCDRLVMAVKSMEREYESKKGNLVDFYEAQKKHRKENGNGTKNDSKR